MVKLDLYWEEDYYGDDFDLLKEAFCKLCEQELTHGKAGYYDYMAIKRQQEMYRRKMLNGTGGGKFYRS